MSISVVSRRKCEQIAERVENENGNLGVVDVPHTKTCQNAVKIQFGKNMQPAMFAGIPVQQVAESK
jgi:hypothetical protein